MLKQKGFTLIELLVVIAIIGILSSVVLSSLNTARGKAADSAIKSDLSNLRAQAELLYDDAPGSYAGVCADAKINTFITHIETVNGGVDVNATCFNSATAYAISSPTKTGTPAHWCVDSTGASKGGTAGASTTQCP